MSLAEQFQRDGWIVVRGVITSDDVASMNDVFSEILPENAEWPSGPDGVLGEITGASKAYEPLARIARDPRFGTLAAEVLGASSVQLLQDSLLYKPARAGASVHWHQDYTYLGFLTPSRIVTVRIALYPESVDSGAMRVVSGSHHWGLVGEIRALTESRVDSLVPSLTGEQRDAVEHAEPVLLEPGDVSLHHCLTLHGSGPNRGDQPRRTILLRMFDGRCRLDVTRLPTGADAHFPRELDGRLSTSSFPIMFDEPA